MYGPGVLVEISIYIYDAMPDEMATVNRSWMDG